LKNVGHRVGRSTIARILKAHGISPVPERPTSWQTFLRAHWGAIAGADFGIVKTLAVCPHPMITLEVRSDDGKPEKWLVGGPALDQGRRRSREDSGPEGSE
jgi:hypothetical protein